MSPGKERPSFLAPLVLYHATNDGMLAALSAMLPLLSRMEAFALTYENIGLLTSLALSVTIVFQLISGQVGDVRNAQFLMAGGIFLLGLCSILITRAYSFLSLLAVILILRVGASFYHPVGISWISKSYEKEDLDRAMGYQSAMGDAGVLVAFITTGYIAIHWGWQVPFLIWGVANIVCAIIGIGRRYDVKEDRSLRSEGAAGARDMVGLFTGFRFALLPLAITGAAYTITINFGPLLITDPEFLGLSADVAGYMIALWIGTGVISATMFGRISSRLGRKRTLLISFFAMAVASAVIGLVPDPVVTSLMLVLFGFFLFITWPGLFAMISEATGKVSQGSIFGVIFAVHIVGGASLAYIAGVAAEIHGIGAPFLILSGVVMVPLVTLVFYSEPTDRWPRDQAPGCGGEGDPERPGGGI